ncbi:unnamed protein product [Mesocestoides corti]|uniref:Uncharacterized protein n=1 Tax=Mesocestoides corti TaxID=53468 RepID=A0A0R3U4U0_MESCO|nr:unnamed protein product [Mesocestoides corti]
MIASMIRRVAVAEAYDSESSDDALIITNFNPFTATQAWELISLPLPPPPPPLHPPPSSHPSPQNPAKKC